MGSVDEPGRGISFLKRIFRQHANNLCLSRTHSLQFILSSNSFQVEDLFSSPAAKIVSANVSLIVIVVVVVAAVSGL